MADNTNELNDINFKSEIQNGLVLVDFWAPWCGPCRMQGPIVETLGTNLSGDARVAKLNVEESPITAAQFGIRSIPTLMVFKNGKAVETLVGLHTQEQLEAALEAARK